MQTMRVPKTFLRRDGKRARLVRKNPLRDAYLDLHRCSECQELFWAAKANALTCCDNCRKKRSRRIRRELAAIEAGQLSIQMTA